MTVGIPGDTEADNTVDPIIQVRDHAKVKHGYTMNVPSDTNKCGKIEGTSGMDIYTQHHCIPHSRYQTQRYHEYCTHTYHVGEMSNDKVENGSPDINRDRE
jgi:hypothetical protein